MQEEIRKYVLEIQGYFGITSKTVASYLGVTYGTYHGKRTGHGKFIKRDLESLVINLEKKMEQFNFKGEEFLKSKEKGPFKSKREQKRFIGKKVVEIQDYFGLLGIAMAKYMNISNISYSNKKTGNVDFFNEKDYKHLLTNLYEKFKNFAFDYYKNYPGQRNYIKEVIEIQDHFGLASRAMADYIGIDYLLYKNKRCERTDFFNLNDYNSLIINLEKKIKDFEDFRENLKGTYEDKINEIGNYLGLTEKAMIRMYLVTTYYTYLNKKERNVNKKVGNVNFFNEKDYEKLIINLREKIKSFDFKQSE
ncbi:MAG: hypothetical protein LBP34_01595 [Flavobacteriaceae bacterium]|jgi:hypothetical protein|nr:hypothetical protein [Flavobacteriaceae bacterium]